jgi:hypothetical protein
VGEVAANRIRLGILALPLAGMLILLGDLILPNFGTLSDDAGYAETVVSTRYEVVASAYMLGDSLYLFGVFALYAYLANGPGERWGLAGLVFVVVWLVSQVIYYGSIASTEPTLGYQYLEGDKDAFMVYERTYFTDAVLFIFDWFAYPGFVLLGIGMWRSGTLPQGAVILGIAFLALNPVAYAVTADLALVTDLLLATASGWIAWVVWRQLSPAKAHSRVR